MLTKDRALFGVAGFPMNFLSDYKNDRDHIFSWLKGLGLDALELQCTYGIRMGDEQAARYKKLAKENDIALTIHAPYYVNLGSKNPKTVENSKKEIIKAFSLADKLSATRIIFHPGGGYGKTVEDRKIGISQIINCLNEIKNDIDTSKTHIYPEIGGKVASLGNLDEIIEICNKVDYAYPCLDLAHLHARENGSLNNADDIIAVLDKIEEKLGKTVLNKVHFHMYPVDYTIGGEKVHKAFDDMVDDGTTSFSPKAQDFVVAIKSKNITPFVICEAHNSQDVGARLMKEIYNK